ncbi:LacI family DNA-binding transcriptional regulator [Hymenobacter crusticola]|uniref:LacI family transcriptional regulator n=1 Tax=Hymenobacter crusticola TaxID=1770526 RepID=A0A243WK58_9BACT|nr:LacI family DNA-binding transcriptional regulator [Hymenobacter crusticola]OUJ76285.1 LacI family transcriptional regulator [Hymenobacter crusticola]
MEKINLKRLADELHLSTSTVSRALQDSYQIGADTKQRVLALAQKLNYVPNPHASSLGSRKSNTIAVVIPEVFDSYFAQAVNGIETVAQAHGYHILIYLTHESEQQERAILRAFQGGRVDGVLMSVSAETTSTEHIAALQAQGVPVAFFDRAADGIETARVTTNDLESSCLATRHLVECGCSHIALLSIARQLSIERQRIRGYQNALAESGQLFREDYVVECTHDPEENYLAIRQLLEAHPEIDGLLVTVELLTVSAYQACHDLGRRIPADVKVVSFSNSRSAAILNPALTTIRQPAFETGKAIATLLLKALKNRHKNLGTDSVVLPSTLIVRASTATDIK